MAHAVDVVVIGMGPGGEDVAGKLAQSGLEVVGIEAELVGGECPYWGCVPSKMMIRAANLVTDARRIPGMAGTADVHPDWAPVARRIRDEATDTWDDTVAVDRFVGHGGTFVRGRARITGPGEVTVEDELYRARRAIVLATGTSPTIPPIPGLAGLPYWTNRDAVATEGPPESLLVLGGGAIGVELAQVFARFGSRVTVVEGAPTLLPLEEPGSGQLLAEVFEREGITVVTGATVTAVRHDGAQFTLTTPAGDLTAQRLLVATGRRADLTTLGLDAIGVDPSARWLEVDDQQRVTDGVWAVGDLTGKGAFTHVAMYQSAIAIRSILGEPGPDADYTALPRVTFTDPEVASVGLTEAQARAAGITVRTGRAEVPHTARGWIHKVGNDGFIQVVEDADRGVLVGATSVGPVGGEVLGLLALAVHARIMTDVLQRMIYAYPTFHRGIEDALRALA
ncbi:MAG: NAD(P)/FAD-dependent oxidoreductase [Frankiales bacterium]|nr:NAD(P)/FAD-dependent oxidoreductase [Frankiales bacterium]